MKNLALILLTLMTYSCMNVITVTGKKSSASSFVISGVISPFYGLISYDTKNDLSIISTAIASGCLDPVYAKLYKINADGSVDDQNFIASQLVGADARYSFNLNELGIQDKSSNVSLVVKASGCNGEVYKRPITSVNNNQDINSATTVVGDVINAGALSGKKLNEVGRKEVQSLMDNLPTSSVSVAVNQLISDTNLSNKFTEIFGSSALIMQETKPEITVSYVATTNELQVTPLKVTAFHIDPTYSFAYVWKVDGVVKSTNALFNYIPGANDSGLHSVNVYAGMSDGNGGIDLSKPYHVKTFSILVNNNILPTAPSIAINNSTLSPRNTNNIQLDINTGISFANCGSFSSMAITETSSTPGVMQFNLNCTTSGTQTENITFTNVDGNKTLYLWTMDIDGNISTPNVESFVLDTTAPVATLSFSGVNVKGGDVQNFNYSTSDAGTGLSNVQIYLTTDGTNYNLLSTLSNSGTSGSFTTPSVNTSTNRLKLVASDITGFTTTIISNTFTIDSISPTAPSLTRTSSAITNVASVSMTIGSCTDTASILITETNSQPSSGAAGWVGCSTAAGGTSHTVVGDGVYTLYAWAKDEAGNVSPSANSVSVTLDTSAPTILSGPSIASALAGGESQAITWSITDATTSTMNLEYFNGTNWSAIGSGLANNGSYSWTVPSLNLSNSQVRITATDSAGNSITATSSNFIIDSTAPAISSFTLANAVTTVNTPTVSVQITANDAGSGLYQMRLSEIPGYANDSWQTFSATGGSYTLSMTPGSKTVYIWVKDLAGNVSTQMSTNIALDFGTAPVLSFIGPSNNSVFSTGDNIAISWSCSSTSGLASVPIKEIAYTTNNGASFTTIATSLTNNDTSSTGHLDWVLPAALNSTAFRLWIKCESSSGAQVEKLSDIYQTNNEWKIWAGQLSAKVDGVLAYGSSKLMLNQCSTGAIDSSGNLFYTTSSQMNSVGVITALMKVNAVTGLIEKMVGDYTTSAAAAGEDLTSGLLSSHKIHHRNCQGNGTAVILGTSLDRSEILFLDNTNTAKIYGIKADGTTRVYTTFPFSLQTKSYWAQSYFLSKNRQFFIFNGGKLYKVDLSSPGNSPIWIYGLGTNLAEVSITVGAEGTVSALKAAGTGGTANYACTDCVVVSNPDGSRIWVGAGQTTAPNSSGTNTWAQLDLNTTDNKYYVTSESVPAMRQLQNAIASDFDNMVYARGRDSSSGLFKFDSTAVTVTGTNITGYNGLVGNTYYNLFSSNSNLYYLGIDQEIKMYTNDLSGANLVAGRNAHKIGDGNDHSFVDFINIKSMTFDPTSGLLAIAQSLNTRFFNFNNPGVGFFSSTRNHGTSGSRSSLRKGGTNLISRDNNGYLGSLAIDVANSIDTSNTTLILNGCAACTVYATTWDYDLQSGIPDATLGSNGGRFFSLTSGTTAAGFNAILTHSNLNRYFQAHSTTSNHSYIYRLNSSDNKIYKVAGKSGAAGYSVSDSGTAALGAQLSTKITNLYEIRNGANAGDILFADNNMIRRLSVTSEAATPNIYDIVNLQLAAGYSASTVIDDIIYDESTEISGVNGTGTFYYVRSSPTLEIHKWKANDASFTSATDTKYNLSGLSLSGSYRLALTPDGLLVAEIAQTRILRLPP